MAIERLQGVPLNRPTGPVSQPLPPVGSPAQRPAGAPESAFGEVLKRQQVGEAPSAAVKFSAHAQQRLASRGIQLGESDLQRIGEAVDRAQKKGARESLLVLRDLALIVSVPHRTVITAVDGRSMRENVFTNIDSAVIL